MRELTDIDVIHDLVLELGFNPDPITAALRAQIASGIDGNLMSAFQYNAQEGITIDDIARVVLAVDDGTDETSYTWIVRLFQQVKGKPWAVLRGWHDYTGWDCQSGLTTELYATEEECRRTLVDWERDAEEKLKAVTP